MDPLLPYSPSEVAKLLLLSETLPLTRFKSLSILVLAHFSSVAPPIFTRIFRKLSINFIYSIRTMELHMHIQFHIVRSRVI